MTLPRPRTPALPSLFDGVNDRPVTTIGQIRGVTGGLFEDVMETLIGLPRRRTDSRCAWCPDFADDDARVAHESKANNHGRDVLIFEHMMDKHAQAIAAGWEVVYWFWTYAASTLGYGFESQIREAIGRSAVTLYVMDHAAVCDMLTRAKRRVINPGVKPSANRKGHGWTLNLRRAYHGASFTGILPRFQAGDATIERAAVVGIARGDGPRPWRFVADRCLLRNGDDGL